MCNGFLLKALEICTTCLTNFNQYFSRFFCFSSFFLFQDIHIGIVLFQTYKVFNGRKIKFNDKEIENNTADAQFTCKQTNLLYNYLPLHISLLQSTIYLCKKNLEIW